MGICWLVSGILPCSDFYLGATVSVAVPPQGKVAEGDFQNLGTVHGLHLMGVHNRIHVAVVVPMLGGDLVEVIAQILDLDHVTPHQSAVTPPEDARGLFLEVVYRQGLHDRYGDHPPFKSRSTL